MPFPARWRRVAWFVGLYIASLGVFIVIIYVLKRLLAP
jgi:hypothetical protein